MAIFGKSEEEKARRAGMKAENARQAEIAAFNATPVGKARLAHKAGQKYFQVSFDLEQTGRNALNVIAHEMNTRTVDVSEPVGGMLGLIEDEGWQLIQSGFTFRQTHQDSRDKFIASGQQIAITGQTVGVYLFRRTETRKPKL